MSIKETDETKMQARLDALKAEIDALRKRVERAEINLQLEYYSLLDELQVKLDLANQKFHRLKQSGEKDWEAFETEFELIWKSLRELIKSVTSP